MYRQFVWEHSHSRTVTVEKQQQLFLSSTNKVAYKSQTFIIVSSNL